MTKIRSDPCTKCSGEGKVDGTVCPRCRGSRREPEAVIPKTPSPVISNPVAEMVFGGAYFVIRAE